MVAAIDKTDKWVIHFNEQNEPVALILWAYDAVHRCWYEKMSGGTMNVTDFKKLTLCKVNPITGERQNG